MKASTFWAPIALAHAPAAIAQGLRQATGGTATASPVPWYPEPTPEVSNCTANLITTLCDYKEPERAVASSGKANCWEYCNAHPPCSFAIFAKGNPYTGTGTCWLYPGEEFDESAGESGCDFLSVYDKPECSDATPTAGACEATASPSAIAEICDYPAPEKECVSDCYASSGATNCLSLCVEADSCSFAVFNPLNEKNSPYGSGSCWVYSSDKSFDSKQGETCSGHVEQFVYKNPCPKPPKPTTSAAQSSTTGLSGGGGGLPTSSGDSSESTSGSSQNAQAEGATDGGDGGDGGKKNRGGSAATALSPGSSLVMGLVVFTWQFL